MLSVRVITDGVDHKMTVDDEEDIDLVTALLRKHLPIFCKPTVAQNSFHANCECGLHFSMSYSPDFEATVKWIKCKCGRITEFGPANET